MTHVPVAPRRCDVAATLFVCEGRSAADGERLITGAGIEYDRGWRRPGDPGEPRHARSPVAERVRRRIAGDPTSVATAPPLRPRPRQRGAQRRGLGPERDKFPAGWRVACRSWQ